MKDNIFWGLLCTIYAGSSGCYISYDCTETGMREDENCLVLNSQFPSPENRLIKKDLYTQLGADAHYILSMIYDSPIEILTPKTGNITKRSIRECLLKNGWKKRRIKHAFVELTNFVSLI